MPKPSLTELHERLREAEDLIRRGVACLNRVGWEEGETDSEWRKNAHLRRIAESDVL